MLVILLSFVSFFMAITFHEFSHALVAYLLGDDTAQKAGRLSLNPLVHIDLIGFMFLVLFRIGWAKPVPMNQHNFKYPRMYAIIAALAGPCSNFLLALICLYLTRYAIAPLWTWSVQAATILATFLASCVQMNVMLGIFNTLPIPPLDGSHIINALVPEEYLSSYYRLMPFFIIGLLCIVMLPTTQAFLLNAMRSMIHLLEKLVI
jgi:Zn-dependent protease